MDGSGTAQLTNENPRAHLVMVAQGLTRGGQPNVSHMNMQVPVRGTTSSEQMKYCISYEHEGTSTTYNPIANNLKEKKSAYLLRPEGK